MQQEPVPGFRAVTPDDQAATLRRLFAQRRARVLPVLVGSARSSALAAWLAKLATGFARNGERTLLIDAARVHVAAALGLRARFDLHHWLAGECKAHDLLLDAAPGLAVASAARAFDAAARAGGVALAAALPRLAAAAECDLVLVLMSAAHARLLPAGSDCVVPVVAEPGADATSDPCAALQRDLGQVRRAADIAGFRLLFLGMDRAAAATLNSRLRGMAASADSADSADSAARVAARVHFGGQAAVARDLIHIVRAAAGWHCAPLSTVALEPQL